MSKLVTQFDLQLRDYSQGYRFQVECHKLKGGCGYSWYVMPADLLARQDLNLHSNLYIDELEERLICPRCKKKQTKITPLPIRVQHHFVAGMA